MKRKVALIYLFSLLVLVSSVLHAEKLDEIKSYFELRDTISLVNLEMKRALAPDSRSPMLTAPDSEQDLTRLVLFLEDRVKQFGELGTPLKHHYSRNLETLFNETRYLYSNVVVRIRTIAAKQVPGSLVGKSPKVASAPVLELQPRPYFHPIDVRTLLSPALINSKKLNLGDSVWANNATIKTPVAAASDSTEISTGSKPVEVSQSPQAIPAKVEEKKPTLPVKSTVKVVEVAPVVTTEPVTTKKVGKVVEKKVPVAVVKAEPAAIQIIPPPPEEIKTPVTTIVPATQTVSLPISQPITVEPPVATATIPASISVEIGQTPVVVSSAPTMLASGSGNLRPLAVMIENHNKARPQSGLIDAELVYEMPVEGGITRFMAVFLHTPGLLGPVRSCREYFVDRALEIDALYVHCGGSPNGYAYLSKSKINSIDEIKHSPPFHRDNNRKAPHNLYANGSKLVNYMSASISMKLSKKQLPMNYGPNPTRGTNPGNSIFIKYHGNYSTSYKYVNGIYERFMNGEKHVDRESNKQIAPATVVVQLANMKTIDAAGRQEISFVGSGTATIFYAGTMINGKWEKKGPRAITEYTSTTGQKIIFDKSRPIWVQVVSPNLKVGFNAPPAEDSAAKKTPATGEKTKSAKTKKAKEKK